MRVIFIGGGAVDGMLLRAVEALMGDVIGCPAMPDISTIDLDQVFKVCQCSPIDYIAYDYDASFSGPPLAPLPRICPSGDRTQHGLKGPVSC